jgi:hypothetical protein
MDSIAVTSADTSRCGLTARQELTSLAEVNRRYTEKVEARSTGNWGDPLIALRMPPEERQAVEAWAANQSDKLSSKAIRELIQLGLAVGAKRSRKPKAD